MEYKHQTWHRCSFGHSEQFQKGCQKSDLQGEGEGRGNFFKVTYVTKLLETGLYRLVKEVNEIFMVFYEDKGVVSAPKMPVGGGRGADILILK